jgi:hypothetical protein
MKKALLYLMLFAYASVMLRPAMPYLADAAAHLLWYKSHVLNIHAHQGKSHAHIEAYEATKKNSSHEEMNKKNQSTNEHTINNRFYFFIPFVHTVQQYNKHTCLLLVRETPTDTPPPKI